MTAEEVIKIIESAMTSLKEYNTDTVVPVDVLINSLSVLKKDVNNAQAFDQLKHDYLKFIQTKEHERNMAYYNAQQQHSLEMFRSVIVYGQDALKSAILINGGAAVALLAFIGNVWTKSTGQPAVNSLTKAIFLFTIGVLSAAIGAGTSHLTQYFYKENKEKKAKMLHVLTIVIVVAAYTLFFFGSYNAYRAFSGHLTPNT